MSEALVLLGHAATAVGAGVPRWGVRRLPPATRMHIPFDGGQHGHSTQYAPPCVVEAPRSCPLCRCLAPPSRRLRWAVHGGTAAAMVARATGGWVSWHTACSASCDRPRLCHTRPSSRPEASGTARCERSCATPPLQQQQQQWQQGQQQRQRVLRARWARGTATGKGRAAGWDGHRRGTYRDRKVGTVRALRAAAVATVALFSRSVS